MEFWRAILGLARRRYVCLPILGAAMVLAGLAYFLTPAHYTSNTTMVLTIPTSGGTLSQDPSKPTGLTNPLLNFGEGLRTTSAILIQAMNTPEVAAELGVGGPTKLTINDGSSNPGLLGVNGPFVYIEAEGASAEVARDVVHRTQDRIKAELINRQKALNAPPITYISIVEVVPPSTPEVKRGEQLQLAGAALALTVIFGLLGTYGAHRLQTARRRNPTPGEIPAESPEPPEPTAAEAATERFTPVTPPPTQRPVNGTALPERIRTRH